MADNGMVGAGGPVRGNRGVVCSMGRADRQKAGGVKMYKDNCGKCAAKLEPFMSKNCVECRAAEDAGKGKFTKFQKVEKGVSHGK
jgi:uncharacterized protein YbaA (DUF1428 family)